MYLSGGLFVLDSEGREDCQTQLEDGEEDLLAVAVEHRRNEAVVKRS